MNKIDRVIIDCEASSRLTANGYLAWERIKEEADAAHVRPVGEWVMVPRVLPVSAAKYMAGFDFDSVGWNELDAAEECWSELLRMASTPPPILKFSNPVFNNGRNLSVRRGEKWRGVEFAMIDLGGGELSPLVSLSTTSYNFYQLRDEMLADEHDPACRTVDGLLKAMCEVYPGFSRDEVVTLVRFNLPYAADAAPQPQPQADKPLWLWRNFVDGKPEYLAFDNAFPTNDGGDPLTLGEPAGYAIFKESTPGRTDVSDAEVLQRIKRSQPQPQASAGDVRVISAALDDLRKCASVHYDTEIDAADAAWQRIRASLGVGRE